MNPKSILNLFSVLILFFSFSFVFPIFISIIFNDDAFYIFLKTFISISLIGVVGLISMAIFLTILIVGFIYEWKKGALEWD